MDPEGLAKQGSKHASKKRKLEVNPKMLRLTNLFKNM